LRVVIARLASTLNMHSLRKHINTYTKCQRQLAILHMRKLDWWRNDWGFLASESPSTACGLY